MKAVLEEIAPPAPAGQKLVRRFVFVLLVFLAALVGSLAGLLLVYSTDLPQIEQLARNLCRSPDRSFHRKIQEALLAIQIERRFSKEQILTLYANQIYLGYGVYGFEAASEFYFSKPAKQLTVPEAALIAGLPKSPALYSPINH